MPFELIESEGDPGGSDTEIYYTTQKPVKGFWIEPQGFLLKNTIEPYKPGCSYKSGIPVLFPAKRNCHLGFDVFSAAFYMASRYEEYLPFQPDRYGRFPEILSTSGQYDFTHLPIIHYWSDLLFSKLSELDAQLKLPERSPAALFTYDIDVAYAYRGRSFVTQVLSLGKDLLSGSFDNMKRKIKSGFGKINDPSDTYKYIEDNPLQKLFFFLLSAEKTTYDRNIHPANGALTQLIRKLHSNSQVLGIHPSYLSSDKNELMSSEKQTLENIINQPVTKNRQHFLRLKFPGTFRALIQTGIKEDYSLQYPEMPGFRAGMCLPFPFFDVEANQETDLMLYPGCIMETTFRDDLHLPASHSFEWYHNMWKQVKKFGGCFIPIWHNDTLWEFSDAGNSLNFRSIHDMLIELIMEDISTPNSR